MAKRLIVPAKATLVVAGGIGTLSVPDFSGFFRYLVVEGPSASAKGRVRVRDVDLTQDLFRDPRMAPQRVSLEFYTQATAIPINGPSEIIIDTADDGSYTIHYTLEERPRRV